MKIKICVLILLITIAIGVLITLIWRFTYQNNDTSMSITGSNISSDVDSSLKGNATELESTNSKSINYLLFNNNIGQMSLPFEFNSNIKNYNISRIELFQDDTFVSNNVIAFSGKIIDNNITIMLSEYVSQFNILKIYTDTDNIICLNVGQYYLESYNMPNTATSKISLNSSHTFDSCNKFQGEFEFTGKEQPTIEIYIPKKIKGLKIIDQNLSLISKNTNNYLYKYSCAVDNEYFSNNKLSNICFDVVLLDVDTSNENIKSELTKCNVSLTSNK